MLNTDHRDLIATVLAVIPAFNEENTIVPVIHALSRQSFDVLVVDDCSSDHTAVVAEQSGAKVLRLPINLGYAGALQTGYLYALNKKKYRAVIQLDADGQHEPEDALKLLTPVFCGDADVVIGSRYLEKNGFKTPRMRRIGQLLFGSVAGILAKKKITDPTSGYQALSLKAIRLYCTDFFPDDYPDADLLICLKRMGVRFMELPVRMYSHNGESMHGGLLKPLYYIYKMCLAIFISLCKKLPEHQ